jgi:hypothetical protein
MKKISTLLSIIAITVFTACTGPEGIPGRDGLDGLNGSNGLLGTTYENKVRFDFVASNKYSNDFVFPKSIYKSDMVLVYRLVGADNNKNDVWKALPETYFFDNGTRDFTYTFDFTVNDVVIYLNGNNLDNIPTANRLGQIFRFVVIPSDFSASVNKNSYKDVIQALNIKENQIQKVSF